VAALCLAGVAVSGYLTWTKLAGAHALLCREGGGCDVVQASHYALLLGVPTALWGAGLYVVIGGLALSGFTRQRWLIAFALASAGVAFSAYLTAISLFVLRAACPYCLVSAAIEVAILAAIVWWRHASATMSRMLTVGSATATATIVAAFVVFASPPPAATPYQVELAQHLAKTGAVMYGAYWCPHCADQKALFGAAASTLPYVECDPKGAKARPDLCDLAGVRSYPLWVIEGRRYEGTQPLEVLARASHFSG
jgi:uncharacterized membrane protein/glutaredoxin